MHQQPEDQDSQHLTFFSIVATMSLLLVVSLAALVATRQATAQTFSDLPLPPAISNTSIACNDALNTTVSCPAFLGTISIEWVSIVARVTYLRLYSV